MLISLPNVIITSHQGYLTEEALDNISLVTLENLDAFFNKKELINEINKQEIYESILDFIKNDGLLHIAETSA